jgi:tRNA(fMet)-specific endonuclease VapC
MRYLVDTDWVIDHLHGRAQVVRRLEELAPDGIGLSILSLAELYEGVYFSTTPQDNENALQDFLGGVDVLTLDDDICRIFAQERGRLRAAGMLIGDFDLLIGATALHYGLTLLTNNRRHFERLTDLDIVSV